MRRTDTRTRRRHSRDPGRERTDEKRATGSTTESGSEHRSDAGDRSDPVSALHAAVGNQTVNDEAVEELHERGELQAKLAVSQPGDAAEREAERVADEVLTPRSTEDERRADDVETPELRRSAGSGGGGGSVSGDHEGRIRSALTGGQPLPASTQSFFEERFGQGFSDVRVHTGPQADEAAGSIDAEAFTLGSDIAFSRGAYQPGTSEGRQLLAHELTHVVQQGGATASRTRVSRALPGPGGRAGAANRDVALEDARQADAIERGADLAGAGSQDESVSADVEAALSTASNLETVLGTTIDVAALFGAEAGAATTATGYSALGSMGALAAIAGPVMFGVGAMLSWADALSADEQVTAVASGAYTTMHIARGEQVPPPPPTEEYDYSDNSAAWHDAAEKVRKNFRQMADSGGEGARNLVNAMTALNRGQAHIKLNQIYQQSVDEQLTASFLGLPAASRKAEAARSIFLLWPIDLGVKMRDVEETNRQIYPEGHAKHPGSGE